MKKYYAEVDLLRGVAILAVLLGHSFIVYPINLMDIEWCRLVNMVIYKFHMPLFFLLAGFCFHPPVNIAAYKKQLGGKIRRLILPYLAFSFLDLLPRLLVPSLVNNSAPLSESLTNIFLYGGSYWFLYTLFVIFLIFTPIARFFKKPVPCALLILIIILYKVYGFPSKMFCFNGFLQNMPYFLFGWLLQQYYTEKVQTFLAKWPVTLASGMVLLSSIVLPGSYLIDMLYALAGSLFFFGLVVRLKDGTFRNALTLCGGYTLQFYLLSPFFLVFARVIFVSVLGITQPFILVCAIFLTQLAGSIVCTYILRKIKFLRFLAGM
ncbi:MAG: acyltransferase [Oscillospiraceae bacterium]|nr:acyltransferase [Oscillospiraceae bacterium]